MSPQLAAFFAAHKTAILGGGAAAVAGLALLNRKKAAAAPARVSAGVSVPGTIPAAAVAGPTAGYDSSSYDAYNGLQQEIGQLAQAEQQRQTVGTSAAAAPKPIASSLFAPNYTGQYAQVKDGTVAEIESDGSLFGLTHPQYWANPNAQRDLSKIVDISKQAQQPTYYTTASNLVAANAKPAA